MSTIERDELLIKVSGQFNGIDLVPYLDAKAIVDDLKRQLADVTKELEQERSCGAQVLHQEREAYNEMRAKLERVTRERDEARAERDVVSAKLNVATKERDGLKRQLNWMHDANKLIKKTVDAGDTAIRQLESLCEVAESERDQAREQLSTVQAEAAAMRGAFSKRVSFGCHFWNGANDTYIRFNDREKSLAAEHAIGSFLQGTAGRDLLDEMKRKDERIKQLEKGFAEVCKGHALLSHLNARHERKCRTAKAALVERYRGKIDPEWFGEQQPTPEPVWQYRRWNNETPGYGIAIWRTSNGSVIESSFIGQGKRYWSTSSGFSSWRECVDDPNTFPCDESGERIEEAKEFLAKDGPFGGGVSVVDSGQADKPLKVGDWVELVSPVPNVVSRGITRMLAEMQWPQQIVEMYTAFPVFGGKTCDPDRFRRVPPPVATVAEQGAASDDNPPPAKCKSCGIAYTDHLGIQGTCRDLQEARQQLAAQAPLVAIAMELQSLMQGTFVKTGVNCCVIQCRNQNHTEAIAATALKLRDAKGGA